MNAGAPSGRGSTAGSVDPQLATQLRLLAMNATVWAAAVGHASAWVWATGLVRSADPAAWAAVCGLNGALFYGIAVRLVRAFPRTRWSRRTGARPWWQLTAMFIPGILALPLVPWLWWRARTGARAEHPAEATDRGQTQLLQLPRSSALSFLWWNAGGGAAGAVVLGLRSGWPRDTTTALVLLWVALAGPAAAIAYGWARAILRPEYLAAAPRRRAPFSRTHDMRLRLVVSAAIASAGAILAPLAAGYLWLGSTRGVDGAQHSQRLAVEAVDSALADDAQRLGAVLADNPSITLIVDGQTFGALRDRIPVGEGLLDQDGNGVPEIFVARSNAITAVVPLHGGLERPTSGLWFSGLACLGCCVLALTLVAADLGRDVERASEQVMAVAQGRAPPPMSELSLSSLEIRELVRSVDRLVGRITEANVAKYVAIEKAKEADRLKSQFLANMSHDLRSPLNSILGFSELLISGIDGELTDEQAELLQQIHGSGRHLLQQIDDILDTAKIEAGRLDAHPEPTPPATLLTRAIQNAKRRGRPGIEFRTEFAAGLRPAFIDPYRGVQALENVLMFAAERVREGVIQIRVRRGVSEDRPMVFISVTTPVKPATAEQLTKARGGFYRIPGHQGLSLGLPIAGSIVELSGGSMGIEDLGEGMEFLLMLPAPQARRARKLRLDPVAHPRVESRAHPVADPVSSASDDPQPTAAAGDPHEDG